MSANPLFSIIMPVYNGKQVVGRAITSVARQTCKDWELLIIDDGSSDASFAYAQALVNTLGVAEKTRLLQQANQGVAVARNTAMAQARGQYFGFLDADDVWLDDKLAIDAALIQGRNAAKESLAGLIYGGYYAVDDDGWLTHKGSQRQASGLISDIVFSAEGLLLPSNTVVHRLVYEELGGFPTDCYHEDRVFFLLASRQFLAFPTGKTRVVYQQSLSGRCRRILSDYDVALAAEYSIIESLKRSLDEASVAKLWQMHQRFLINRFIMYGFINNARRLHYQLAQQAEPEGMGAFLKMLSRPKSLLSWISLKTGLNVLQFSRYAYQTAFIALNKTAWSPVRQQYWLSVPLDPETIAYAGV
ncbi:MAG: glycosyltransferase family 2 protein [Vampirovibrionales bacterium]|nr:glycosyltransferase family 2 protein [Vampirovibrionales bacterium]